MKADILRRAEEVSDSEEEEEGPGGRKTKGNDLAFEDDLDDEGAVKVRDGDPSADEGSESEDDGDDGVNYLFPFVPPRLLIEVRFRRMRQANSPKRSWSSRISVIRSCSTEMLRRREVKPEPISRPRQVF